MTTIDRILKFIELKGISVNEFSKKTGISNGYLAKMRKSQSSIGSHILEKIVRVYSEINPTWLLTGNGEMLKSVSVVQHSEENKDIGIPYYEIDASAGPIEMFSDEYEVPEVRMVIPGFEDCDMAIDVFGDSMHDVYRAGDRVLCKRVHDRTQILYGEAYVIVTSEFRTIKYLQPAEEKHLVKLCSENDFYKDVSIQWDKIIHLFLVKGRVRRNSI